MLRSIVENTLQGVLLFARLAEVVLETQQIHLPFVALALGMYPAPYKKINVILVLSDFQTLPHGSPL